MSVVVCSIAHAADSPTIGSMAPNFKLQDQNGQWHILDEYRGKWLALYFYPKDNTPGCTSQAPSGKIVRHYVNVNPKGHSQVVLKDIKAQQAKKNG